MQELARCKKTTVLMPEVDKEKFKFGKEAVLFHLMVITRLLLARGFTIDRTRADNCSQQGMSC